MYRLVEGVGGHEGVMDKDRDDHHGRRKRRHRTSTLLIKLDFLDAWMDDLAVKV